MKDLALLTALARAFLAGEQTVEQVTARGAKTLGWSWEWLPGLSQRYLQVFGDRMRPRLRSVIRLLEEDYEFGKARAARTIRPSVQDWLNEPHQMWPVDAARNWDVPVIETAGDLADRLHLTPTELDWFADLKGLTSRPGASDKLRHYLYRILQKGCGSLRLIEAPKVLLKELQRRILVEILDRIPLHPAIHGFRTARSITTFVAGHVGKRVVLRMDLQDFFPSISGARVQALFRTLGYPEPVADLLGGLCSNATPSDVWRRAQPPFPDLWQVRALYRRPHLPQGAPTSPALSNLCAFRFDCRLAGLAKSAGAQYTRYADDLAFSGDEEFERRVRRFSTHVAAILQEEGFTVHHRKTRIMRQGVRQHLAGLVVNQSVNVMRDDCDRLKAILTNCVRLGPESQNRAGHRNFRAHLEGRVGFVEMVNNAKGQRLRQLLDKIQWTVAAK